MRKGEGEEEARTKDSMRKERGKQRVRVIIAENGVRKERSIRNQMRRVTLSYYLMFARVCELNVELLYCYTHVVSFHVCLH